MLRLTNKLMYSPTNREKVSEIKRNDEVIRYKVDAILNEKKCELPEKEKKDMVKELNNNLNKIAKSRGKELSSTGKCLFPNCDDDSIGSHRVSKMYLKQLHKEYIYGNDFSGISPYGLSGNILELTKLGIDTVKVKQATFCKSHDNNFFQPIEKQGVNFYGKKEQFLFAYKALVMEYHRITVLLEQAKDCPQNFTLSNKKEFLKILASYKSRFEKCFDNDSEYSSVQTVVIELPYKINFACSTPMGFSFDVTARWNNVILYNYIRKILRTPIGLSFITCVPASKKSSYILISSFTNDKDTIMLRIWREIFQRNTDERRKTILQYLNVILSCCCDTLYLSPYIWEKKFSDVMKKTFKDNYNRIAFPLNINQARLMEFNLVKKLRNPSIVIYNLFTE